VKFNRAYFSASGLHIVTYDWYDNEAMSCWQASDGKLLRTFNEARGTLNVSVSKSKPHVLIASRQVGLFHWNFETGEAKRLAETATAFAVFDPKEERIVSATHSLQPEPEYSSNTVPTNTLSPMLQVWNADSGQLLESIRTQLGAVSQMQFVSNNELLLSATFYGVSILDVRNRHKIAEIAGHSSPLAAIEFGRQGKWIASASWDHTVGVWDSSTGKLISWLDGHKAAVTALATSPRPDELASGGADGEVILWKASTGERIRTLQGHKDLIYHVFYSPQGDQLLTNSRDGTMRMWNEAGETVHTVTSVQGVFLSVDWSSKGDVLAVPGGQQIAVQERNNSQFHDVFGLKEKLLEGAPARIPVYLYRAFDAKPILLEHGAAPRNGVFSRDGTQAVTVDIAGMAHVWNVEGAPQQLRTVGKSNSPIVEACFSPDGKRLLTRHATQLSLWDAKTGEEIATFADSRGASANSYQINPLVNRFTPDSQWLITIEPGSHLRRWPTDILGYAEPLAPAELSAEEKTAYRIQN
jgi:WD40 repeat protein